MNDLLASLQATSEAILHLWPVWWRIVAAVLLIWFGSATLDWLMGWNLLSSRAARKLARELREADRLMDHQRREDALRAAAGLTQPPRGCGPTSAMKECG